MFVLCQWCMACSSQWSLADIQTFCSSTDAQLVIFLVCDAVENIDEYTQSCVHVCYWVNLSYSTVPQRVSSWRVHSCLCVCCISPCVWRECAVSRLSDSLNNLSLLSFLSLNPRWGCSSGIQQDRSALGASSQVIYGIPPWLWWSTTLRVSVRQCSAAVLALTSI